RTFWTPCAVGAVIVASYSGPNRSSSSSPPGASNGRRSVAYRRQASDEGRGESSVASRGEKRLKAPIEEARSAVQAALDSPADKARDERQHATGRDPFDVARRAGRARMNTRNHIRHHKRRCEALRTVRARVIL